MIGIAPISYRTLVKAGIGLALFAAATGAGFAAWIDKDAEIFRAMIETGLSWCM